MLCGGPTAKRARYCCRSCAQKANAMNRNPELEMERRRKISKRMKVVRTEIPNPMSRPEVRKKLSETMRAIGHKPPILGGNGRAMPIPVADLLLELNRGLATPAWHPEHVFPCGHGHRELGVPPHYKIDIANPVTMVAVEVDGPSHKSLRVQDADDRKNSFLRDRGWIVLRFTNAEVLRNTEAVAEMIRLASSTRSA